MKIYVVMFHNFHGDYEYCGAFSSQEIARSFIEEYGEHEQASFVINEETLDEQ